MNMKTALPVRVSKIQSSMREFDTCYRLNNDDFIILSTEQ